MRQVVTLRKVLRQVLTPGVTQVLRDLLRRKPPHLKTHLPAHLQTHLKTHPPAQLLCPRFLRRPPLLRRPRLLSSSRLRLLSRPRRLSHLLAHLLLSFRLYLLLLSSSTKLRYRERVSYLRQPQPFSLPYSPECLKGVFSEAHIQHLL